MFSRASEKDCDDGRGHQQKEDTGASGYGTVTQVSLTAVNEGITSRALKAALDRDTLKILWKNKRHQTFS